MHFKKRRGGAAFVVECTLIGGMVEIDCTLSTLGVRVEVLLYCAPLPLTLDQSPLRLTRRYCGGRQMPSSMENDYGAVLIIQFPCWQV